MIGGFLFTSLTFSYAEVLNNNVGPSGLPLPRFVSIKPARVNVRVGPGSNYAIVFTYQKKGLPIEIIQEYDQWRKIRDAEGDEGWVYQSLLSGKRTAITIPWQKDKTKRLMLRKTPTDNAPLVAEVEPNIIGNIRQCNGHWCELSIGKARGWLHQTQLWGIYPGEKIKN
ncbi:SH3 domain-containing protein [Bartonella bacilliformis]